jgi:hypothetical protein
VWKLQSACINHTRACRYQTRDFHIYTHTCQKYFRVWKPHSACGNRALRVEANLVRFEITLVRGVITFVRVEITLASVIITLIPVKITLYV